jgi:glucose-6-phosphate 1-dehydrogenase
VIFGGTGDLAMRKLLPALFDLRREEVLGNIRVLAVAREDSMDDEAFRHLARAAIDHRDDAAAADDWLRTLHYQPIREGRPADFDAVARRIGQLESDAPEAVRIYYLALPPAAFAATVSGLAATDILKKGDASRVVIEKPFGRDFDSARQLNALLHQHLLESQIYRIDHYLGKETVQNLLVFRFANTFVESLWNRAHVSSVQITVAETLGIGNRAGYYDSAGVVRDMMQNHLTQLVSLVAMDPPVTFDADGIRTEKIKAVRSIQPLTPDAFVAGQYGEGEVSGEEVIGYLEEKGVSPGSKTAAFAAARLNVDSWRWTGVPFFLRTGKRMPASITEIALTLREPPVRLFETFDHCHPAANALVLRISPDEGFELHFDVKGPGEPFRLDHQALRYDYSSSYHSLPEAYRTLIAEIVRGDQTLFVAAEEAEASWKLWSAVIDNDLPIHPYRAGTWGPAAANNLIQQEAHGWRVPRSV